MNITPITPDMDDNDRNCVASRNASEAFKHGDMDEARYWVNQDNGFGGTFSDWLDWKNRNKSHEAEMERTMQAHSTAMYQTA